MSEVYYFPRYSLSENFVTNGRRQNELLLANSMHFMH